MSHWGRQFKDFVKKTCKGILTISNSSPTYELEEVLKHYRKIEIMEK